MRMDHDLLGEIAIPDSAYYGAQTQRSLELCNPSKEKLKDFPELINSIAAIKKACAIVHCSLGTLSTEIAGAIEKAADEIIAGKFTGQFPVDLINGGGCSFVNMNINEVIANRANEIICGKKGMEYVHSNTHVNMGQSTNDVIPSAIKLAAYYDLLKVIDAVVVLKESYAAQAKGLRDVVKVGRTCYQDAVPITLGQFYSANVEFLERQEEELRKLLPLCLKIPLGATAVGTGLGSFRGYQGRVMDVLSKVTGLPVTQENNLFDGLQYSDIYLKISGTMKSLATGISKMARDIRLMSSGPRAGLKEITIAPVQNGSSIMPGKVNPSLPELMNIVCYQICGNDVSISMAVEGGELELNVWESVVIVNLLNSCHLLAKTIPVFSIKCVDTIQPNAEKCAVDAEHSISLSVVLSSLLGYQKGTEVALYASDKNLSIKEAAVKLGYMNKEQADMLLEPGILTDVNESGKLLLKMTQNNLGQIFEEEHD